jgi:hypothetical protein
VYRKGPRLRVVAMPVVTVAARARLNEMTAAATQSTLAV